MKYVYDGNPLHEARLCFVGEKVPIYMMDSQQIGHYVRNELSKEERELQEKYSWNIDYLELPTRCANVCKKANIATVGQLVSYTAEEFGHLRNVGVGTLNTLIEILAAKGLKFKESEE